MIHRFVTTVFLFVLFFETTGQNRIGIVPIDMPKFYNDDVAYTTSIRNATIEMAISYDAYQYKKEKDLTPIYIDKTTKDFTIVDEKVVLIDTVKKEFADELVNNISTIIDPGKIDFVISNHAEMDHSGCVDEVIEAVKPEKVICSRPVPSRLTTNSLKWGARK